MRVAIAGATGQLGQHVVNAARAAGHTTVGISRASGVDLMTGAGLADALFGADAVIDVSSTSSTKSQDSVEFFSTVTRTLLEAERKAGVPHHVAISIIGASEVNASYYAGKKVQEDLVTKEKHGGWSLLRTTQFHGFVRQIIAAGKMGPLQLVPTMRSQPVAAAEVAAELVSIAAKGPTGLAPDLAGPQEENMAELVRKYLTATDENGRSRRVLQVPSPGVLGSSMRKGILLPGQSTRRGTQTYEEWLEENVTPKLRDD